MSIEIQKIKMVLKEQLKKRKVTYEVLAQDLGVSVPTIKRWLGDGDLGLNELSQLAEFLNMSMLDIHLLADKLENKSGFSFTKEQDEFLAQNTSYYAFLMRLHEGMTPEQIATKYNLTKLSLDKYLLKLEQLNLITVSGKQKVRPVFERGPSLGIGMLSKAYYKAIIKSSASLFINLAEQMFAMTGVKDVVDPKTKMIFAVAELKISKESYEKWHASQVKAFSELEALSKLEERSLPEESLCSAFCVNAHALLPLKHPELERMANAFGVPENL